MLDFIHDKWTANGSDIEMLYFILFLFACMIVMFYMNYRSNKQMIDINHQIEMERIKRRYKLVARSKK